MFDDDFQIPSHPWKSPGKLIESLTRKALHEFKMLEGAKKLAIALSGGKDSLTLLFMLKAIVGKGFPQLDITAIHVSGTFSCGPSFLTPFLNKICTQLGIEFINVKDDTQIPIESLECYSCSRRRRTLLFNKAKEVGCDVMAFGHHKDDNAQTIMMNLCQKGTLEGMLPNIHMYKYGMTIIRPFIFVDESSIISLAKVYNFHRIVCRCPVSSKSKRKTANTILDFIEHHFPGARTHITNAGINFGSQKAAKRDFINE